MPNKELKPAMAFLVEALKSNKSAVYADLHAQAEKKGLKIYPIMYGRAQALLGHVKSKPRGAKATAKPVKASSSPARAGSKTEKVRELLAAGHSPAEIAKRVGCTPALVYTTRGKMGGGSKAKAKRAPRASTAGLDGLAGILDSVKTMSADTAKFRGALEKIGAVLAGALAS